MPSQVEHLSRLTLLFQSRGVLNAREIQEQFGLSQSRVSRLIAALGQRVIRMGATRSSRYALRRDVRQFGSQWPLYRIDDGGGATLWARLQALHGGYLMTWPESEPAWLEAAHAGGVFSGLPFFLEELRPQGFLGRIAARAMAESGGFSADPRQWSQDDVLVYLLNEGDDLPGDLVIGERMLERVQRRNMEDSRATLSPPDRVQRYPEMAERAARGDVPGSSTGGEQPKFMARMATPDGVRSVLVKFTAPTSTPSGRRWADLLLAEWYALEVLRSENFSASKAEIIDAGGRRFLEVERFDRVDGSGRRGVISLGGVEAALLEQAASTWIPASSGLEAMRLLDRESAEQLRRLASFGELIANTDMHLGNVAFWFGDRAPFQLAPAYDMLPMLFAPTAQGELVPRDLTPRPPPPELLPEWSRACHWALGYWRRIRSDERFSRDFVSHAVRWHDMIVRLRDRFAA